VGQVPKIADGRAPRDGALVCRQLAPHSHKADTTDFTTEATTNNSLNQENLLLEELPSDSDVDGHDFGSGQFNIFVLTDHPQECFQSTQVAVEQHIPSRMFQAAYREIGLDKFVTLWPPNLHEFVIA
jgi:hypothetical protein